MSSRSKRLVQLGRKLNAESNNKLTLVQPGRHEILPRTYENQNPEDPTCSKDLSEPPLNTADRTFGHNLGPEVMAMEGEFPTTSFSSQSPQESSRTDAVSSMELHENQIFHPESLPSISGNQLLEDLDYSASSSDNYEPSSSSSETDSDTSERNSDHEQENHSNQMTEKPKQKTTPKRKLKRKTQWKKNIQKAKRVKGESYTGHRGVQKPPRPLLPAPCLAKPKHKCKDLVNEQDREKIYREFRNLSCSDDQRQFLCNHIEQNPKKRTTRNLENSRKTYTCGYYLTVNGTKFSVCREFFMATLNVTDAFMRSSIKKRSTSGILEKDRRGKHAPSNKLPENSEKFIRDHILSFPSVESHYCRKKSTKKYLDASLNISIMYRMYKDICNSESLRPVTLEKYRQIFKEYNLGFFKPKKDQCKKCLAQKNLTEEESKANELEYKNHLEKKEAARRARDYDKSLAKENQSILAFNFDLQAVLTTPKGPAGQIFYLRKLAVYNFTVYNLGNQDVRCYLWDETQGKRGANEIASCIYDFIMSHNEITAVRMMSDGCGGQQKNSFFATMCLQLCLNHPSLETIDHQFFETGHTEMECDSIHSKIEKKSKHVPVYTPEGWAQVIRDSRITPQPFKVRTMMFDDFLDFKAFSASSFNFSQIPWRRVCCLRYIKGQQSKVFYKTDYAEEFIEADCSNTKSRGRPKQIVLSNAYTSSLAISEAKSKDLQKMCKDLTIPKAYHSFYQALKTNKNVRDKLPEPDAEESESDTDTA